MLCRIECMVTNSTGQILITGSSHGLLSFREIWSLQELYSIDMNESGAIRSLSFTEGTSNSCVYSLMYTPVNLLFVCSLIRPPISADRLGGRHLQHRHRPRGALAQLPLRATEDSHSGLRNLKYDTGPYIILYIHNISIVLFF